MRWQLPDFFCSALALVCCLGLSSTGCMRTDGRLLAAYQAQEAGFTPQRFDTADLVLRGWLRCAHNTTQSRQQTLHVYIEGDGMAWVTRSMPSTDPTPTNPVALSLAQADPTQQAVLYLARPCQYTEGTDRRGCTTSLWTTERFSAQTLRAMHSALNQAKHRTGTRSLALYGFSGGGGIAALLAAQRDDVLFLGTVAGNLDHVAWTRHHAVTALSGSLNPAEHAQATQNIPQIHVTGSKDAVIPSFIADAWCASLPQTPCVRRTVSGATHAGPWSGAWSAFLLELRPELP